MNILTAEKSRETKYKWQFISPQCAEKWHIPKRLNATISGAALWISHHLDPPAHKGDYFGMPWWVVQFISSVHEGKPDQWCTMDSPRGLHLDASTARKVTIKLLNNSPETDGYVGWSTAEHPGKIAGKAYFHMKPYSKQWQNVVCHIDHKWKGIIDQLFIAPGLMQSKGDIWISEISITDGASLPARLRPDLVSEKVVPKITIPDIKQEEFQDAFNVLNDCLWHDVPFHGFEYPFFAPAGDGTFGWSWWQLDCNVALGAAKWADQSFAENVIRGFIGVQAQNPDGRIDHCGKSPVRGGCHHLSSLPRYFEAAYDIAKRSSDEKLRKDIYSSLCKYHEWWYTPGMKRDPRTGLITAWFEETVSYWWFGSMPPYTIAPVDTNVAVALGSDRIARLAQQLGYLEDEEKYRHLFDEHCQSINDYLWDEKDGFYYPYNVKESCREKQLFSTTFDPFRGNIVLPERIDRLIPRLLDHDLFNWQTFPLNTAAKTHPHFVESSSDCSNAWFGSVWYMRNLPIIDGLIDIGYYELAGQLAWKTIRAFTGRYSEYLSPLTGEPRGASRYCWSGALYIQTIIEYVFGIDYDQAENRFQIMPLLPDELADKNISLRHVKLPIGDNTRLDIEIYPQKSTGHRIIRVWLKGDYPSDLIMTILQPQGNKTIIPRILNVRGNQLYQTIDHTNRFKKIIGIKGLACPELVVCFSEESK